MVTDTVDPDDISTNNGEAKDDGGGDDGSVLELSTDQAKQMNGARDKELYLQ